MPNARDPARVAVIEKEYQELAGVAAPEFFTGSESGVASEEIGGAPKLQVRCLLPSVPAFDFAVTRRRTPGIDLCGTGPESVQSRKGKHRKGVSS